MRKVLELWVQEGASPKLVLPKERGNYIEIRFFVLGARIIMSPGTSQYTIGFKVQSSGA